MDYSPPGSSVHGILQGKNARVGCHFLLQGIFPTQESNPGLLHCRQILYRLNYEGSPLFCVSTAFVQLLSHIRHCNPWTAAQAPLSSAVSLSLLKFMSPESVMPSNHLILCCPLLLLPSIFPSIRVFSNELALHVRWPKYYSFSLKFSPSSEYSGLISFRIDWFDLLEVQRTLKGLLQHHNFKASSLQHSAFFMVQLSCLYKSER